ARRGWSVTYRLPARSPSAADCSPTHRLADPLQSVLTAFIVSRPEFEEWLAEQARAVCGQLSDR
ncbi:MAG TPA: hypothetical protein VGP69_03620, partial [Gaiellaceae bacterium]|nr:hypothetical protein [Gaiellaceae bacterium]